MRKSSLNRWASPVAQREEQHDRQATDRGRAQIGAAARRLSVRQPLRGDRRRFLALTPTKGSGPPVVMIHGNPTWSVLYRGLIEGLRGQYRCMAVDLAGFGLSVPPPDFSFRPEDHARLIAGLLDRLDLKDAALVAHDWGGPVGLGAAMMTSGRISSLCLGNTWAWPVNGDFHFEWFSKLMGGPIGRFGSERYVTFVNLVMPSAMRRRKLSAQELDLYRAPFVKLQSRRGMHVFPWEITASRDYLARVRISSPFSAGRPISSGRKTTSPFATRNSPAGRAPAPGRGAAGREMRPLPLDRRARRVPRRGARISRRESQRLIGAGQVEQRTTHCVYYVFSVDSVFALDAAVALALPPRSPRGVAPTCSQRRKRAREDERWGARS